MSLQTFRGRSIEEAKSSAERALGKDYVVLSSRRVEKSKLFGLTQSSEFEVTAAPKTNLHPEPSRTNPFAAARGEVAVENTHELQAIRSELRNEVRSLRNLFNRQQPEDRGSKELTKELEAELGLMQEMLLDLQTDRDREPSAKLKRLLAASGIEGLAARTIAKMVRERGDDSATNATFRAVICDLVRTAPLPLAEEGRTLISLIGPSGVGKTTTAAKLAAVAMVEQGRSVTLVTSDSYRVGATPQLERFASLLGAEFCVVKTRHGLEEAIVTALTDVVIIDTAGRPGDRDDIELSLSKVGPRNLNMVRRTILCLPAALREVDARKLAKSYAPCNPTELCITKLDETSAPSGLVHAPVATKLPISTLCFGQRVPEDLGEAHPKAILDALVPSPSRAPKSVVS